MPFRRGETVTIQCGTYISLINLFKGGDKMKVNEDKRKARIARVALKSAKREQQKKEYELRKELLLKGQSK
jgi:hypothetical protein